MISAVGIGIFYIGLTMKNAVVLTSGTLIYACFTFPSFPIMMEQIGKRVGKNLDLIATGNVFFLTQLVTAVVLTLIGLIISGQTKG